MAIATKLMPQPSVLPIEEPLYEVVGGQRVEPPPMGVREVLIATTLACFLRGFARDRRLGRIVIQGRFPFARSGNPKRRPDVAFDSYERWPRERPIPPTND